VTDFTHHLPMTKRCQDCGVPITWVPSRLGKPVCLECAPWDGVPDPKAKLFEVRDNVAHLASDAFAGPLYPCHTGRPGHEHFSRTKVDLTTRLASTDWDEYAASERERAGHRCERCGIGGVELHVHHRNYDTLGHEVPQVDTEVLCDRCHQLEHGKLF
jgi:hypothetical protein